MDDDTNRTGRARVGRGFRLLLGGSLALNLLVAGLAIGAVLRFGGGHDEARRQPPPPPLTATLYRALPREDRKAVRGSMREPPGARLEGRRASARELATALRSTPFDGAWVESLVTAQLQARGAWEQTVLEASLHRISAMSDSARAAYVERVENLMTRKKPRHQRRD